MRKEIDVVVDFGGPNYRDRGKTFRITEMPASEAEEWALHALTLVAQVGVDLPEGVANYGWAGMAIVGLDALMKVDFVRAKPLLDRMMACVQIVPDPAKPFPHRVTDDDVEEVQTRLWLRDKVFELHSNFSVAAGLRRMLETAATVTPLRSSTQTSPSASESP